MPKGKGWETWIRYDPGDKVYPWRAFFCAPYVWPGAGVEVFETYEQAEQQARDWAKQFTEAERFNAS